MCRHFVVHHKYLQLAQQRGLSWPLPESLTETALCRLLNPEGVTPAPPLQASLEFALIHRELQRTGVTRLLLWEEYVAAHPAYYGEAER